MSSVLGEFLHHQRANVVIPSATSFYGDSCSHRLKKLEKWNRCRNLSCFRVFVLFLLSLFGADFVGLFSDSVLFRIGALTGSSLVLLICGKYHPQRSCSSCCATSVAEGVRSQLSVCSQCSEKVEHKCSCCNMKEIAHIAFEDSGNSLITEGVDVVVAEDGLGNGKSVNIHAYYTHTYVPSLSPEEDVAIISEGIPMCQEFGQALILDGKAEKCLGKSKTFPPSKENSAGTSVQSRDSVASGNSTQGFKSRVSDSSRQGVSRLG